MLKANAQCDGKAFGRYVYHEGGDLTDGSSTLTKETPQISLVPSVA